jgi:LuxR family maltose regulon positive regulatory protein
MTSFDSAPDHLLQTKLYPPRVPERLVRRQGLLDHLQQRRDRPVTLVSAPAGYGKSTLVTQWLSSCGGTYAWLSLDGYDNGLVTVLAYMIAAMQTVSPEFGAETELLLVLPQLPAPEKVADTLLMDIQQLPEPLHLVLDDYHTITDPSTHLFMMRLLQRLPQSLRLVIISRADPPLGLSRLRGRGRLREIRGSDLRFSAEEAALLIEQIVGRPVARETANAINERIEGWPVGLRMVAMSLRASDNHSEFTRRYAEGGQKLVSDYLLGEVLDRLPDEQRLLLLRTAVVDRFCAPLVDVLAEQSLPGRNGYDFLQGLWTSNFFLIALDVQGTWYRYHHLFRQLLLQQMQQAFSAEALAALHLQAGEWFENAGYIEDAIIHAAKAGQPQVAAKVVERHVHEAVNQEEWRVVDRWVNLLPEEARQRPGLLAIQAMLEQFRYRLGTMIPLLDAAIKGLDSGEFDYTPAQKEAWMGVINAYRAANVLQINSPRDSLHYAHRAMRQVDPAALYVHSLAELWYIYALQQSGKPQQAVRLARRNMAGQTGPPDVRTNRLMLAQAATYCAEVDVYNLHNLVRAYLELALRTKHQISLGWANFFLGWCAYQGNQLAEAERCFSEAVDIRYFTHMRTAVDCITGQALLKSAIGAKSEVKNVLQFLREFIIEQGAVAMLPIADSLALRLDLHGTQGGSLPDRATQVATQLATDLWDLPILTACRMGIESGDRQRLAAADNALAACRTFAQSRNAKRQLLQIDALQTLFFDTCGEGGRALDTLKKGVLLAEPGGALRIFVDFGPALLPYFEQLRANGVASSYIDRILAAYSADSAAMKDDQESALSPTAVAIMSDLTNREMEVLLLLAERLTNKEIAARLHISPRTVKKHSINLYSKLQVENRRQAVARALEVGIL